MAHQTFYRKYRSRTFSEIIGQEHIIKTLENAIQYDRLTHAYIFSGPRGTGKTSMARILAKALNCREGKSVTPCLKCDICQKITAGSAVDVIEIDAASNTGVDNIRALNEQINFYPVECLYKIYIIDEAHMLTTGAFNALLKTIEEPPKNTLFILATTEPHKIPVTIHSRCQRLNFRQLTNKEIKTQLKIITEAEGLVIDETGLNIIARNASGCMRDAITLLDQIYSFKGKEIATQDILLILGSTNFDSLIALIQAFIENKPSAVIQALQEFINEGINMSHFTSDLIDLFKQMLFIKLNLIDQLDLDESRMAQVTRLSDLVDVEQLKQYLEVFSKAEMEMRWMPNAALLLQVRFLVLMHQNPEVKPQEVPQPQTMAPPQAVAPPQSEQVPTASNWNGFVSKVQREKPSLFMILNHSQFLEMKDSAILIQLSQGFSFFHQKLEEPANKKIIEDLLAQYYSSPYRLSIQKMESKTNKVAPTQSEKTTFQTPTHHTVNQEQNLKINQIVELFEGTLV